ncbi:hypothetical protein NRS6094_04353 [Bacillus subtilis]|uniref:hypothetical protein n=1 Tax=Bacillus subtilis TaxID=1423 RepID=UPI001BA10F89|nr:hypothetical protein [Bacillus subtilis]CAF1778354.1 hypothetical protein NRS6094_04353 [Bacillus subtilis]
MSRLQTMARFDERIPEPTVIGKCKGCGEIITASEEFFDHEGEFIHDESDCIREYFKEIADLVQ